MTAIDPALGRVYLAARYSRAREMQGVRHALMTLLSDVTVTSRWIDHHGGDLVDSVTTERLATAPETCAPYALADLEDLGTSDTVISFTGQGGKGGRHVEFGMAVALAKRCIVVGPREHVFHALPTVEHYISWSLLVAALSSAARPWGVAAP